MTKKRVQFTFPTNLIREPVIYLIGKNYDIVTNIRRADVAETFGWVQLELDGDEENIRRALDWARDIGVRVDLVEGDVVAG